MLSEEKNDFIHSFHLVAHEANENAKSKGFWDNDRDDAVAIALMHSELSEALESHRHGDPPSDKIPEFTGKEEEFADVIIRIMDTAQQRGLRIPEALLAKMEYNASRPHMHGKKL